MTAGLFLPRSLAHRIDHTHTIPAILFSPKERFVGGGNECGR